MANTGVGKATKLRLATQGAHRFIACRSEQKAQLAPEETAASTLATRLYCCGTSSEVSHQSGLYYEECKVAEPASLAYDSELGQRLWVASESWGQSK